MRSGTDKRLGCTLGEDDEIETIQVVTTVQCDPLQRRVSQGNTLGQSGARQKGGGPQWKPMTKGGLYGRHTVHHERDGRWELATIL